MFLKTMKNNISDIQAGFKNGDFSSSELVSEYLKKIKSDQTNCFISLNKQAVSIAKQADKIIKQGQGGPLTGVPIAIKDIILVKDLPATAGSQILKNYTASYTATAVGRLEAAGMIVLGKTNCDEFAMGSSNENSSFGPVLNPHDHSRVAGGSSGGSAAAVALGLTPVALGTDTGGSIRQPASFCGVVGLKPSYGRVSRFGSMAMASSLDQIGPLANTVEDCALILKTMAGFDKNDSTASLQPVDDYLQDIKKIDAKKLTIGLPKEYFAGAIDSEIKQALDLKISQLQKVGLKIKEVSLPNNDYALAAYYLLMPAEVSSNLARFDGLLYGATAKKGLTLEEWYETVRSQGFGKETKRRIILGTFVLSAGYYEAYYKQAQKVRTLIKQDFDKVFKTVDILLTPSTPTTAFRLGEKAQDPLSMYLSDVFTVGANVAGICGLSLPIGQDQNNLPIGLQLLAGSMQENKLFALGNFIENL